MVFTIGHAESYEKYFQEQITPKKKGRTKDYSGGTVWKSQKEALNNCPEGYSVYGVFAVWGRDTAPSTSGPWHDLLIDADLFKLNYRDNINVSVGVRKQEAQDICGGSTSKVSGLNGTVEGPIGTGVFEGVVRFQE